METGIIGRHSQGMRSNSLNHVEPFLCMLHYMHKEIQAYHKALSGADKKICDLLAKEILLHLPEAEYKIWHRHPVWFLEGNPIVGYSKLKDGVRLLFWSGVSFTEKALTPGSGKFKDASMLYTNADDIDTRELKRWLKKSRDIQWDYKNIVKRKGLLKKIKVVQK